MKDYTVTAKNYKISRKFLIFKLCENENIFPLDTHSKHIHAQSEQEKQ